MLSAPDDRCRGPAGEPAKPLPLLLALGVLAAEPPAALRVGLLPLLLLPRYAAACCWRAWRCRTYSVGSKRCLGGALLGRGGRGGVASAGNRSVGVHEESTNSSYQSSHVQRSIQQRSCRTIVPLTVKLTKHCLTPVELFYKYS
jgi:hypothetical protein